MIKTTTTRIWATDDVYLNLDWAGGAYYYVSCWCNQHVGPDNLEGISEFLTKSQIRDLIGKSQESYSLGTLTRASSWLKYALNECKEASASKTALKEGGVL